MSDNIGWALGSNGGAGSWSSKLGHGGGLTLVLSQFDFEVGVYGSLVELILMWVFMDFRLG